MKPKRINVASFDPTTQAHGPGNRFALWVQGCPLTCEGCINPEMLGEDSRNLMTPENLTALIQRAVNCIHPIEGLTLMGGEPTSQAEALIPVIEDARAMGLNILTFSGFTLKALRARNSMHINRLLELTDTLIDGPFNPRRIDTELIRGSTNQRIIHLTEALEGRDFTRKQAQHSIESDEQGGIRVSQSGFFKPQLTA